MEGKEEFFLVTKKKELLWLGNTNNFDLLEDIKIKGRFSLTPDAEKKNEWEI